LSWLTLTKPTLLRRGSEQDPRNVFHLAKRRVALVRVAGAETDRECDPEVVGQSAAFDDLVAQTLTFDDGGEPAREEEGRLART
jgi:hypothetical protein